MSKLQNYNLSKTFKYLPSPQQAQQKHEASKQQCDSIIQQLEIYADYSFTPQSICDQIHDLCMDLMDDLGRKSVIRLISTDHKLLESIEDLLINIELIAKYYLGEETHKTLEQSTLTFAQKSLEEFRMDMVQDINTQYAFVTTLRNMPDMLAEHNRNPA